MKIILLKNIRTKIEYRDDNYKLLEVKWKPSGMKGKILDMNSKELKNYRRNHQIKEGIHYKKLEE